MGAVYRQGEDISHLHRPVSLPHLAGAGRQAQVHGAGVTAGTGPWSPPSCSGALQGAVHRQQEDHFLPRLKGRRIHIPFRQRRLQASKEAGGLIHPIGLGQESLPLLLGRLCLRGCKEAASPRLLQRREHRAAVHPLVPEEDMVLLLPEVHPGQALRPAQGLLQRRHLRLLPV